MSNDSPDVRTLVHHARGERHLLGAQGLRRLLRAGRDARDPRRQGVGRRRDGLRVRRRNPDGSANPEHRGTSDAGTGEGAGGGGGYGVNVRPLGVYSVGPDGTRWHPAIDLNKVILGGQAVAVVLALVGGWVLGRRRR
ncbi:hypothetical protein NKG05_00050 [Oerskovia sp. M15]